MTEQRRHPGFNDFAAQWLACRSPLSTLRYLPHDGQRMTRGQDDSPLLSCIGLSPTTTCQFVLAHSVPGCCALVDWTGRLMREDKRGVVDNNLPPILERLHIGPRHWLYMTEKFESRFKGLVGAAFRLKAVCQDLGYRRTPNAAACHALLT